MTPHRSLRRGPTLAFHMLLNKCLPAGLTDHLMCLLRADRAAAAAGDAGECARLVGGDTARSYWPKKPEQGKGSPLKYVRLKL